MRKGPETVDLCLVGKVDLILVVTNTLKGNDRVP